MLGKEQMIEKLILWNVKPGETSNFWNFEFLNKQPLKKIQGMYQTHRNKLVKKIIASHAG